MNESRESSEASRTSSNSEGNNNPLFSSTNRYVTPGVYVREIRFLWSMPNRNGDVFLENAFVTDNAFEPVTQREILRNGNIGHIENFEMPRPIEHLEGKFTLDPEAFSMSTKVRKKKIDWMWNK